MNNLEFKSVAELKGYKFHIPSQQRGYRWRKSNVKELIDDLIDFSESDSSHYCLQPLAVVPSVMAPEGQTRYSVLDGQQRLTTLYLLLKSLGEPVYYEISYQRDTNSERKKFLESDISLTDENIDFFYISKAYQYMLGYLDEEKKAKLRPLLQGEKENKRVEFIWYLVDTDAHEVFRNLNSGKIALSNADLIKAMLLSDASGIEDKKSTALQYNDIQEGLMNDRFWYMVQPFDVRRRGGRIEPVDPLYEKVSVQSRMMRMDLLFNLVAGLSFKEYQTDALASFRYFYDNRKGIDELWKKVRHLYLRLTDLYSNTDTFHYIGYLTYCRRNQTEDYYKAMRKWISLSEEQSKKNVIDALRSSIRKYIKDDPSNYDYSWGKEDIRRLLLLHNIETLLYQYHQKERDEQLSLHSSYEQFPFELLYRQNWDIEHMASQTDNPLKRDKDQKEWLEAFKTDYSLIFQHQEDDTKEAGDNTGRSNVYGFNQGQQEEIRKRVKEYEGALDGNERTRLFNELHDFLVTTTENALGMEKVRNKDGIGNLVLLDHHTNRSFHNSLFPTKRRIIIEANGNQDSSKGWAKLTFIPPCTKYAFMKYYNKKVGINMSAWTESDYQAYLKDMQEKLSFYYSKQ